jgi:hypothetical protein
MRLETQLAFSELFSALLEREMAMCVRQSQGDKRVRVVGWASLVHLYFDRQSELRNARDVAWGQGLAPICAWIGRSWKA